MQFERKIIKVIESRSRLLNTIYYNQIPFYPNKQWILKENRITILDQNWSLEISDNEISLYYNENFVGVADPLQGISLDQSLDLTMREALAKLFWFIIQELEKIINKYLS